MCRVTHSGKVGFYLSQKVMLSTLRWPEKTSFFIRGINAEHYLGVLQRDKDIIPVKHVSSWRNLPREESFCMHSMLESNVRQRKKRQNKIFTRQIHFQVWWKLRVLSGLASEFSRVVLNFWFLINYVNSGEDTRVKRSHSISAEKQSFLPPVIYSSRRETLFPRKTPSGAVNPTVEKIW